MGTSEAESGEYGRSVGFRKDGLLAVTVGAASAYLGCSFHEYRHSFATTWQG